MPTVRWTGLGDGGSDPRNLEPHVPVDDMGVAEGAARAAAIVGGCLAGGVIVYLLALVMA